MAKTGPIIIVEDDVDDQEIIQEQLKKIGILNRVIFFDRSSPAFTYLKTTTGQPFIILCDINLPGVNGLEFKRRIDDDDQLRQKSIPFIFYTTTDDRKTVTEAYSHMTVQGFFKKPSTLENLKETLEIITAYWKLCRHPNS